MRSSRRVGGLGPWALAGASLWFVAHGGPPLAPPARAAEACLGRWVLGPYLVRLEADPAREEQVLSVLRGGWVLHTQRGLAFDVPRVLEGGALRPLAPGRDVDGDGVPDLVVSERTGGGHLSQRVTVLRLGPQGVEEVARAATARADLAFFEDVDGDGRLELRTHDWTFTDGRLPFADAPLPDVILRFGLVGFEPAWELMRGQAATPDAAALAALRADPAWAAGEVPPPLWGLVIDQLYAGSDERAWRLLADVWPHGRDGQEDFRRELLAQLARSPYWRGLSK